MNTWAKTILLGLATYMVEHNVMSPILMRPKKSAEGSGLIPTRFIALAAICFFGLVAGQRFTLPLGSSIICLAVLVWSFLAHRNDKLSLSLAVLSVFFSVDHGVIEGNQTPTLVRYLTYAYLFFRLLSLHNLSRMRLVVACVFLIYLLFKSLLNEQNLNISQLWRDLQTFLLFGIYLCAIPKEARSLDFSLITYAISAYLFSELFNFFFLKDAWEGEYLNYSSTKFLIIWPSLYFLFKKFYVAWIILTVLTLTVLTGYGGRTLFLSYLLISLFLGAGNRRSMLVLLVIGTSLLSYASFFLDIQNEILSSSKALSALHLIFQNGWSAFYLLDPVRFYESKLFFEQPIMDLLFGNGMGAGLHDAENVLGFVGVNDTAFSRAELSSNRFFGFHDVWVDWGVRFGLLATSAFFGFLAIKLFRSDAYTKFLTSLGFVGCVSAFYGIAPLIITATFLLSGLRGHLKVRNAQDS